MIPKGKYIAVYGDPQDFWHWLLALMTGGGACWRLVVVNDGYDVWGFHDYKQWTCLRLSSLGRCALIPYEFDDNKVKKYKGSHYSRFTNNCFIVVLCIVGPPLFKLL